MLIVRASGGLSNRLQAVISGVAYCLLTGRTICVDWRDGLYSDDFSNVFELWFDLIGVNTITCTDIFFEYQKSNSIKPIYWEKYLTEAIAVEYLFEGNEHTSNENKSLTSIDLNELDINEDIAVYWHWNVDGLKTLIPKLRKKFTAMSTLNDDEIAPYILKHYILPKHNLLQQSEIFIKNNFSKKPIGIHIRHTDLQSPLPLMIAKLQKTVKNQDEIFLCTDNENVEKMIKNIFPQTVVREKIYLGNNIPLHSYVEGVSNEQKGREAILDMLILSHCKEIIYYSHSSFAKIPIMLSGLENKYIHGINA